MTIAGSGFTNATVVDFGAGNLAGFIIDSDTKITAFAPPGSAGTIDLTVSNAAGQSATSPADLYTFGSPVISGVLPGAGRLAAGTP